MATAPDDANTNELVDIYRFLVGEHEDWDAYRTAIVEEERDVLRIRPTRAYGLLQLPPTSDT